MTSSHASRMKHESTVTWLSTVILYCLVLLGWVFFNLDLWSSIHRLLNLIFLLNRPIANPWNLNDSQIVKFYRTFRIIVIKLMIFFSWAGTSVGSVDQCVILDSLEWNIGDWCSVRRRIHFSDHNQRKN